MCAQHGFHVILMTTWNKCMWKYASKHVTPLQQNPNLSSSIITCVVSWIRHYDPEPKQQVFENRKDCPKEEILHNAIILKGDADTGFKLQRHYSSAMPMSEGNCKLWVQCTEDCFVACSLEKKGNRDVDKTAVLASRQFTSGDASINRHQSLGFLPAQCKKTTYCTCLRSRWSAQKIYILWRALIKKKETTPKAQDASATEECE